VKKVLLVQRDRQGDWSQWEVVRLIKEHTNTWHIWYWMYPFGTYIHKRSLGQRIEEL